MRAGSPPSATVPSTALFKDSNLSAAIRSLVATRCPTSGGVNARAIGPNATHDANRSHTERRSVFLEADKFRHSRAARSDTTKTAMAIATLNNGAYEAPIASLGGKRNRPVHIPASTPTVDATAKCNQWAFDKSVARPVITAMRTSRIQ